MNKVIEIQVHLENEGYARFTDEFFYKFLVNKCSVHEKRCSADSYKRPFDADGFHFKFDNIKYFDKQELYSIPDGFLNRDIKLKCKVQMYDFVDKKTSNRITGCSIRGLEIRLK